MWGTSGSRSAPSPAAHVCDAVCTAAAALTQGKRVSVHLKNKVRKPPPVAHCATAPHRVLSPSARSPRPRGCTAAQPHARAARRGAVAKVVRAPLGHGRDLRV